MIPLSYLVVVQNNLPILLALSSLFHLAYVIHGCISVARGRMPEATMNVGQGREQAVPAHPCAHGIRTSVYGSAEATFAAKVILRCYAPHLPKLYVFTGSLR